jgi:chaperonin GroES
MLAEIYGGAGGEGSGDHGFDLAVSAGHLEGVLTPPSIAFSPSARLQLTAAERRIDNDHTSNHDRVVIKRIEAEEKTSGGIIIPDTAKEKPQEGEVIAVGPGGRDESGKLIPIDVKVGDRVLFGKWSGTEVKLDGVEYIIMKETDLMGVLVEAGGSRKAA